jgi:hypothetical protein
MSVGFKEAEIFYGFEIKARFTGRFSQMNPGLIGFILIFAVHQATGWSVAAGLVP